MAVTLTFYNLFKKRQLNGSAAVDFDSDTLKWTLHTNSYVPNIDTDEFYSALSNELSTGGGYIAGGLTATGQTLTVDTAGDFAVTDQDDPTWSGLSATFRRAVLRKDTGVAGTSPLICYVDFGADQTIAGVDFAMVLNAVGLFKLT